MEMKETFEAFGVRDWLGNTLFFTDEPPVWVEEDKQYDRDDCFFLEVPLADDFPETPVKVTVSLVWSEDEEREEDSGVGENQG